MKNGFSAMVVAMLELDEENAGCMEWNDSITIYLLNKKTLAKLSHLLTQKKN